MKRINAILACLIAIPIGAQADRQQPEGLAPHADSTVAAVGGVYTLARNRIQVGQVLLAEQRCIQCEVTLRKVVELGAADGDGMLESSYNWARRDSSGNYYIWSPDRPYFWVFDPSGGLVQRVGSRGEGPGEFQGVSPIVTGQDGGIFAFDPRQRRLSIYSASLEFLRTEPVRFRANVDAVLVESGIVINAGIHTPEESGYPLHLLDFDGEVLRSFGSVDGVYRPDMRDIIDGRAIGAADGKSVWSGWLNQYVVERWSADGELELTIRRDVDWFEAWWMPTPLDKVPQPMIRSVIQEDDVLWVLSVVPDPAWRTAVELRPDGRLLRITDRDGHRDTVIEAIDTNTGEVLASSRFPENMTAFAAPGQVYGQHEDPDGNITIPVWDLSIDQPGRH